jgi:hypothetical protein
VGLDQAQQRCGSDGLPLLGEHARDDGKAVPAIFRATVKTGDRPGKRFGEGHVAHGVDGFLSRCLRRCCRRAIDVEADLTVVLDAQHGTERFPAKFAGPAVLASLQPADIRLIQGLLDAVFVPEVGVDGVREFLP